LALIENAMPYLQGAYAATKQRTQKTSRSAVGEKFRLPTRKPLLFAAPTRDYQEAAPL